MNFMLIQIKIPTCDPRSGYAISGFYVVWQVEQQ